MYSSLFLFPCVGFPKISGFLGFSVSLFLSLFSLIFSVSFAFSPEILGWRRSAGGFGGTAEESPHKKLADASEKRATDVAHKKTKKLPYIWVAEWFFFFSLYSIYRACYLFQISPPCLPMLSGGCFVW